MRPGSIVHSDEWRSYRQIQGQTGLSHRTVNHSINFVEPITGVHTQNIESYWNVKKNLIKKCEVASENYCTGTFKNNWYLPISQFFLFQLFNCTVTVQQLFNETYFLCQKWFSRTGTMFFKYDL